MNVKASLVEPIEQTKNVVERCISIAATLIVREMTWQWTSVEAVLELFEASEEEEDSSMFVWAAIDNGIEQENVLNQPSIYWTSCGDKIKERNIFPQLLIIGISRQGLIVRAQVDHENDCVDVLKLGDPVLGLSLKVATTTHELHNRILRRDTRLLEFLIPEVFVSTRNVQNISRGGNVVRIDDSLYLFQKASRN